MSDRIKPSDLRAEAQRLILTGRMPTLDTLLSALAASREKFVPMIRANRQAVRRNAVAKRVWRLNELERLYKLPDTRTPS
jgi:hypothetical protein